MSTLQNFINDFLQSTTDDDPTQAGMGPVARRAAAAAAAAAGAADGPLEEARARRRRRDRVGKS